MTLLAGEVERDLQGRSLPDWREGPPAAWRREEPPGAPGPGPAVTGDPQIPFIQ